MIRVWSYDVQGRAYIQQSKLRLKSHCNKAQVSANSITYRHTGCRQATLHTIASRDSTGRRRHGRQRTLQGNEREDAISVLNRCRHLVKQHLKPGLACGCSPTTSAKVPYHCRGLIEAYRSYAVDGVTPSRDSARLRPKVHSPKQICHGCEGWQAPWDLSRDYMSSFSKSVKCCSCSA